MDLKIWFTKFITRDEADLAYQIPCHPVGLKTSTPIKGDLVIGKKGQSGFIGSDLDKSLKDCGIDTLLTVGFSFKSCLFLYTCGCFPIQLPGSIPP